MSEIDAMTDTGSDPDRSTQSVAELFMAAGLITPARVSSPHSRPRRSGVVSVLVSVLVVGGIVAAIYLG
jgi:hypothetical protein